MTVEHGGINLPPTRILTLASWNKMNVGNWKFIALACALLTGCATYQLRPITPAQMTADFEARSLASGELHAYIARHLGHDIEPWPPQRWDRKMLTLAAFYYSPALDVARAQWGTAKAGVDVAGAVPNPVLQLPFDYTTNSSGPGKPYTVGLGLDIPIETANKRGYRIDQASHLSKAAQFNIGNEAWKVRSQVRDALLNLYAARQRVALLTQKVSAQRQILDMLEKRAAVGYASEPEVNPARIALTKAQTDLAAAKRSIQDGRARLAVTIGISIGALESVQLDLDEFAQTGTAPPSVEVRRMAIFNRADLQSSLAEYEATQAALQLEIAKQYPDIHIGPGYTYDVGANKIGFGLPGITLPIINQNQGGIAQAEAKRTEAATRTVALQDTIINDLDHAFSQYQASLDALTLSNDRLAAAMRQVKSQVASFDAGATDRLSLTQSKADFEVSAIDHLNDLVTVQQSAGALEDAMQRTLTPNEMDGKATEKESQQ